MSRQTNYKRGTIKEREIRSTYETKGWYVMRASGSHGLLDLLMFNTNGQILGLQVKRTKAKKIPWSSYKAEIGELERLAESIKGGDVRIEFWVWWDRRGWHKHIIRDNEGVHYLTV